MCMEIERMRAEAAAEAREIARKQEAVEIAMGLLTMGLGSLEQIATATKLTLAEVQELAEQTAKQV